MDKKIKKIVSLSLFHPKWRVRNKYLNRIMKIASCSNNKDECIYLASYFEYITQTEKLSQRTPNKQLLDMKRSFANDVGFLVYLRFYIR